MPATRRGPKKKNSSAACDYHAAKSSSRRDDYAGRRRASFVDDLRKLFGYFAPRAPASAAAAAASVQRHEEPGCGSVKTTHQTRSRRLAVILRCVKSYTMLYSYRIYSVPIQCSQRVFFAKRLTKHADC